MHVTFPIEAMLQRTDSHHLSPQSFVICFNFELFPANHATVRLNGTKVDGTIALVSNTPVEGELVLTRLG